MGRQVRRRGHAQEGRCPGGARPRGAHARQSHRRHDARGVGRRPPMGQGTTTTTGALGRREQGVAGQGLRPVPAGAGRGRRPRGCPAAHGAVAATRAQPGHVPPWGIGPLGLLVGAALVILGASGLGALLNWLCPAVTSRLVPPPSRCVGVACKRGGKRCGRVVSTARCAMQAMEAACPPESPEVGATDIPTQPASSWHAEPRSIAPSRSRGPDCVLERRGPGALPVTVAR